MAVERTLHCDLPECNVHVRTATPPPYIPAGFLVVLEGEARGSGEYHFCGWECAMRYAAKLEPPTVIEWPEGSEPPKP